MPRRPAILCSHAVGCVPDGRELEIRRLRLDDPTNFNTGTDAEASTGRIDELLPQPDDTITFLSQGGGGYGDPGTHDHAAVLDDVRRGLVSHTTAARSTAARPRASP
jgi:N-methylhydantoinase B/oxoprolinase/acetone carboxylase alpha subunit